MLEKDWVGIHTESGSKRYYPLGKIGSDVIGYMGAISSQEYYNIAQELKTLQAYLSEREAGEVAILPKGFQNPLEVREKLKALQEKAYTINDLVGKSGVEGAFDAELRGYVGKKTFEVDTKGNFLRELPGGRKGVSGQRLLLSISSELQEFAEELLASNETVREARNPNGEPDLSTPWIKGGAIVAMDPQTGEVLAMASYPRVDPNDFIPSRVTEVKASKQAAVAQWLENETYIGQIWDGKRPLERERFDEKNHAFFNETLELNLKRYFEIILPPQSDVLAAMQKITNVGTALSLQQEMERLLKLSGQEKMSVLINALYADEPHRQSKISTTAEEKKACQQQLMAMGKESYLPKMKLDPIFAQVKHNDDKLLMIDLCRMLVDKDRVSADLLEAVGSLSLSGFRELNQSVAIVQSFVHMHAESWFHQIDFQKWRDENFKEYLKAKRREEKEKRQYAKPYTEYLDKIEKQMFKDFWDEHRLPLVHAFIQGHSENTLYLDQLLKLREEHPEIAKHAEKIKNATISLSGDKQIKFLQTMRSFDELDRPLYGRYRSLRKNKGVQLEMHLAAAFYPLAGFGYGRSQAFRQSTPQGSVFKLAVAYQGLLERFQKLKDDLNPLTLIDNMKWHPKSGSVEQILGYTLDGQTIKRLYKGGLLPRSHPNIGRIDVIGAIEQSSNIYFSLIAGDCLDDPLNLVQAARAFGLGEKTGIEVPGEIVGVLPDDITFNRTGLYSFAIGQHSLIVTPLQTSVMLAAIANKGKVLKPKVIQVIAGQEPLREYRDPFSQALFPFQENLASIGIHFPLFSATQSEGGNPYIWYSAPEIRRTLNMPDVIRDPLIKGMHQVIVGPKGTARPNIIRALAKNPQWMRDYLELKNHLVGKTGTAEILYKQTVDSESVAKIQNHIWFGGIAFADDNPQKWENPEIVIVVYLRYSESGGKEAAPLGVEIVKKWREICKKHGRTAYVLPEGE
jgi:cell division protein FtsI/penicillin-binding protein 2